MKIREMFKDDIDRQINGVVQVGEEEQKIVEQEVKEYVVTSELKKHFTSFFNQYSESIDQPTDDVGVWITGFFGSGKSHFLKMLSYLLENKEIDGKKTVDYFEEKFDDELSFMNIQKSVQAPTETVLFNIDAKNSGNKDDNSVMRVFYKVFYDHIGLYGSDLKIAKLEQHIINQGKMDAFKEAIHNIEDLEGEDWEEVRTKSDFFEEEIEEALVQADVMSEKNAEYWFEHAEVTDTSPESFVKEVKKYVDSKPEGFRLLFMIDEAGQFIGESGSMLLNLQSLVELFGSICRGQVWVIATGQEALDDMALKLRQDEFSRIMARFAIRLSLTSSSVGEVIEKRLLTKTDQANTTLDQVYANNENVLSNLYAFDTDVKDLKGYSTEDEFKRVYPFVPYQFTIMQKVFNEIRKHGHAGKHQSSGERSMLNGFQESAQNIEDLNELTLVPMYAFYDTLHSFLDTAVRSVIERAEKAANEGNGLLPEDINLLKLLYLIRYIDDIKSNIENLTILMADNITVDKMQLREQVKDSLNRLQKQNYISRNGDVYQFLTDDEQDIAREISNTQVDSANVISEVCSLIFDDIYTNKKYRYLNYDFDFDKSVDNQMHGQTSGGMKLQFITEAEDMDKLSLITNSKNQAICSLSKEYSYFEDIQTALKIEKFVKQKNWNQYPDTIQDIVRNKQREGNRLKNDAKELISKAIVEGTFYIDGEEVSLSGTSPKAILDKALSYLVEHTYDKLHQINYNAQSESEIRNVLNGSSLSVENNQEACEEVYRYLEKQNAMRMSTSMSDIQNRYQGIPYGWRDIDVAYVIAQLIVDQKVTIKFAGQTIQSNNSDLIAMLRSKSKTGSTTIAIRESIPAKKIKEVKDFLKEYFDCTNIPADEDGLVQFIIENFSKEKTKLEEMNQKNQGTHPGMQEIQNAKELVKEVLLAKSENIALVNKVCELSDDLLDSKEDMEKVDNFYSNQITLYDNAVQLKEDVFAEKDYLMHIESIQNAFDRITDITKISNNFRYNRIPELNACISTIHEERNKVLLQKQDEVKDLIEQCRSQVQSEAKDNEKLQAILIHAEDTFNKAIKEVDGLNGIVLLEAKKNAITSLKDQFIHQMKLALMDKPKEEKPKVKKKNVRQFQRQVIFNTASITNEAELNQYLQNIKNKLMSYINDDEEIEIK